jgi:hypothetical protein
MGIRFRLVPMIAFGALCGGIPLPAAAPEFCALSVKVSDWEGRPINFTWMELADSSGRVERRESVGSEFRICDFGFGPHTLRIGTNECFPVAVSNLEVRLGSPIVLDVRMPKCAYGHPMYGSSSGGVVCRSYFRTTTADGAALPEVEVLRKDGGGGGLTDSYGRWQGILAGTRDITFSRPGYAPKTVRVRCPESGALEMSVALAAR